ncbi:MAG: FHA domain-containing protein [Planctomycetaceae bacterium]
MAGITIQILEGFERGRVFTDLPAPVTIGREEDNAIQLNDERVSRFHVKIQEDSGRVILTDLDSTNGTRVNGHPVQVRVLQHGDQLSIGRSLLLYGSPAEIDQMLQSRRDGGVAPAPGHSASGHAAAGRQTVPSFADGEFDERVSADGDDQWQELFPQGPPELPGDLRMAQAAQLSDVLAYIHEQLALLADQAVEHGQGELAEMRLHKSNWQRLLALEMQLARYLRQIANPGQG